MANILLVSNKMSLYHLHQEKRNFIMRLKSFPSKSLVVLALGICTNMLPVTSASAVPYDYTVTGTLTGTFNSDLSVVGGSFNSWSLTTPTATFTNLTGTTLYNDNFSLLQVWVSIPSDLSSFRRQQVTITSVPTAGKEPLGYFLVHLCVQGLLSLNLPACSYSAVP